MLKKIMNYYNTNAKFHSLVTGVEMAVVGFVTSYSGGLPTTKTAWVTLGTAAGGAVWGAVKRWAQTNAATVPTQIKS